VDAEEREHGVDPAAVGEAPTVEVIEEAVGEAPTVEAWRQLRSGRVDDWKMIVTRVRAYMRPHI
jgi:hypothetical protein